MTMTGGTNSPDGKGPTGGPNGGLAGRLPNMLGLLLARLLTAHRSQEAEHD